MQRPKGRIGDPDNPELKDFGICYATHALPSTDDLISEPITGFEFFFCHLYDLEQNTTYYLRSFLTFDDGTVVYSDDQISFTTEALTHDCSPPPNNIWGIDFAMSINDNTWGPNEFEIKGQGATSDLSIEFRSEPRSGVYLTAGESTDIEWSDQCAITLVRGQGFIARQLQRVDVENLGNGVFNITFCDLEFLGNSANFTSDGCIMLE